MRGKYDSLGGECTGKRDLVHTFLLLAGPRRLTGAIFGLNEDLGRSGMAQETVGAGAETVGSGLEYGDIVAGLGLR